jgi:hypothetical protein
MGLFIEHPWLAFLGAVFFGWLWSWRRARSAAVAAGIWALYGVWEYLILARIACSGECNIRVDLLLLYPILAIVSAIAVLGALRPR